MKWCFIQLQNLRNIDNNLHDKLQSLSTYIAQFVLDLPSPDDVVDGRVGDLGDVVEPLDVIEVGEELSLIVFVALESVGKAGHTVTEGNYSSLVPLRHRVPRLSHSSSHALWSSHQGYHPSH